MAYHGLQRTSLNSLSLDGEASELEFEASLGLSYLCNTVRRVHRWWSRRGRPRLRFRETPT